MATFFQRGFRFLRVSRQKCKMNGTRDSRNARVGEKEKKLDYADERLGFVQLYAHFL